MRKRFRGNSISIDMPNEQVESDQEKKMKQMRAKRGDPEPKPEPKFPLKKPDHFYDAKLGPDQDIPTKRSVPTRDF